MQGELGTKSGTCNSLILHISSPNVPEIAPGDGKLTVSFWFPETGLNSSDVFAASSNTHKEEDSNVQNYINV